ncbi:unnamed protein product [Lathyrus sativus]|nr:unnamed protein product [Lathyrus sativus]
MITQNKCYYKHIFALPILTLISITLTSVSARLFPNPSEIPTWMTNHAHQARGTDTETSPAVLVAKHTTDSPNSKTIFNISVTSPTRHR